MTDFTLVPQPAKAVTEQGKLGYTRYDAEADTYTWEVPAQQRRDYTIKETGHTLQGDKWRVNNRYLIRNHPQGLSGGYQDYPEESGITITAAAYGNDVPNTAGADRGSAEHICGDRYPDGKNAGFHYRQRAGKGRV